MHNYNIQLSNKIKISFKNINTENIDSIILNILLHIPFENLDLYKNTLENLSKEYIFNKIYEQGCGGLCYELNPFINEILKENNLNVSLIPATIFDNKANKWSDLIHTHVTNIWHTNEGDFLIDVGFGIYSPKVKVPLNGNTVKYKDTLYKVTLQEAEYILEFKKVDSENWTIGYNFPKDYENFLLDYKKLNEIRMIIAHKESSPFNKGRLVCIITNNGHKVLTENSYTEVIDGNIHRKEINSNEFNHLLNLLIGN